ncbi:MAG: hypothetical protein PF637_02900 [Spirochaetes bacterium]|nr:hypothetical protein [Spirochaetota bacterium]
MSEETTEIYKHNIFIKCRFKSSARNLYGLILIDFNPSGVVENYQVIASTFSETYEINPQSGWEDYENQIVQTKWNGKYNNNITRDFQLQLDSIFDDTFQRTQLFEAANDYDYGAAEQMMYDSARRILQDKNMKLELSIQEVSADEITMVRNQRETERQQKYQKEKESGFSVEEGSTVLSASLVLSPVNGKPLYDLKIGEKIMIKLDPSSSRNQQYISLYNLKSDNNTYSPVPAEVIDIKATSKTDPVQILTRIEESVYAKSIEDERQVKLRIYNAATDRSIQAMKSSSQKAVIGKTIANYNKQDYVIKENSGITIVLSIGLALLLFILIVAIYILL